MVFYGACTTPPDICIVTEWVPRGSLHRVLAGMQNDLDMFRLLSFATDIARGLVRAGRSQQPFAACSHCHIGIPTHA